MAENLLLDASDIAVTVSDGVATLEGTVATRADKRLAEAIADEALGVEDRSGASCGRLGVDQRGPATRRSAAPSTQGTSFGRSTDAGLTR